MNFELPPQYLVLQIFSPTVPKYSFHEFSQFLTYTFDSAALGMSQLINTSQHQLTPIITHQGKICDSTRAGERMNPMAWVGNTDYSKAKRDEVLRKSQEFLGGAVWPKAKTNTAENRKETLGKC